MDCTVSVAVKCKYSVILGSTVSGSLNCIPLSTLPSVYIGTPAMFVIVSLTKRQRMITVGQLS